MRISKFATLGKLDRWLKVKTCDYDDTRAFLKRPNVWYFQPERTFNKGFDSC